MLRKIGFVVLCFALAAAPVRAACPAAVPGSTPEAIEANGARLVCLQNELAAATAQRKQAFDLQALENKVRDIQLQQRLNALPPPYTPPPVFR